MKKVKMFLSLAIVFAVIGSALAFIARLQPDIFRCVDNKCVKYANQQTYSSLAGLPVTRPANPFKGIEK